MINHGSINLKGAAIHVQSIERTNNVLSVHGKDGSIFNITKDKNYGTINIVNTPSEDKTPVVVPHAAAAAPVPKQMILLIWKSSKILSKNKK